MATAETETIPPVREVVGQDDKGRDLVMYGGETCRVCSNGALQRVRDGVMVRPPTDPGAVLQPVRTSAEGAALAWQRWHGKRQEAIRAAVERASGSPMADIDMADAYIVGDVVETIVLNVDVRPDHRIDALKELWPQSGMDGRAPKQAQNSPGAGIQINIGADVAAQMMAQLMQQAQARGILDGDG